MLAVLGGLAEFERELIRARTAEGRKRAKERGVCFGRPPKLTPHQRAEALQRLANGETQADIARTYAVDPTTIGRLEAAAAGITSARGRACGRKALAMITAWAALLLIAFPPPFLFGATQTAPRLRAAGIISFYVSPDGTDDGNDCLTQTTPCRTIQNALSRAMNDWDYAGGEPFIRLAPGTYEGGVSVAGQPVGAHTINIVGQQMDDAAQSCPLTQAQRVIIQAPASRPVFDVQDLAILIARCLTVQGADGAIGFSCRQTPALDIAFVQFGATLALSTGVSADDGCGVNLGGQIWIGNNLFQFLAASNKSRITVGVNVPITAVKAVSITHFTNSTQMAEVDFRGGVSINGPIHATAQSLVWRGGTIITNGLSVPGGTAQGDTKAPGYVY
jgi:Resolvase, N terminal domain